MFQNQFPSTSPGGAYVWRGDLTGFFFALRVRGAYIWRGLYMEGLIFGILRYFLLPSFSRNLNNVCKHAVMPPLEGKWTHVFYLDIKLTYLRLCGNEAK